jgi:hypothetical protein
MQFAYELDSLSNNIDCSYAENYCRFATSCDKVPETEMSLNIALNDKDASTYNFHVNLRDHLIDAD